MAVNILSPFGPVLPIQIPAMLIGWFLIPLLLTTVFRKFNSAWSLAIFGFFFGFIYCWMYIPASVFILDIPFLTYFYADIVFELIFAVSNFLTILWLYEPLKKLLREQKLRYDIISYQPKI